MADPNSSSDLSDAELEAYLDEALTAAEMAAVERALRQFPRLTERLAQINQRRDAGVHSLGDIWRRHRISCPSREQLGSYLLNVLPRELSEYVEFHIQRVGCRYCEANLDDLRRRGEAPETAERRRGRYFESSAGYLPRDDD